MGCKLSSKLWQKRPCDFTCLSLAIFEPSLRTFSQHYIFVYLCYFASRQILILHFNYFDIQTNLYSTFFYYFNFKIMSMRKVEYKNCNKMIPLKCIKVVLKLNEV